MEKIFKKLTLFLLSFVIFIFPFFFLPITQEFFLSNKLYLLIFVGLLLVLISTIKFAFTKKITWQKGLFDNLLVFFLLTLAISIVLSSPNKIQAILNPNFGFLTFFSLTILYFYLSRNSFDFYQVSSFSALFLSLLTIILFFQPLKNINFSPSLQFLKNSNFTPIGNQLDLVIFLGFFVVYGLTWMITSKGRITVDNGKNPWLSVFLYLWLFVVLTAFFLSLYSLLKPVSTITNQPQSIFTTLPPFRLSWYAAVETLKNPLTALFGLGMDNFSSIFTRVKDIVYNQSPIWQIFSFNFSRSSILHLFTETGFLGILAFSLLIFSVSKQLISPNLHLSPSINPNFHKSLLISSIYLIICLVFFPPSLVTWFLLFLIIAETSRKDMINYFSSSLRKQLDLTELLPFYVITIVFSLIFIPGLGYLLGRSYLAEIYFKKALDGIVKNDARQAYENMRKAIILNPYIEDYRRNFSQLNLLLANNIASKVTSQPSTKEDKENSQLLEQDRQNISQAIQAAISEAKAAVSLNPQKAQNWENLAKIYQNIINIAQGAEVWAISAYQRAIIADPQNPVYRLNLGGVYYSLGNFDEAIRLFEQAVILKPDWPLAYYNLAWANFQKQNYQAAISAMENVIKLLDPQKDKVDYNKAKKELEDFKKKLVKEEEQAGNKEEKEKKEEENQPRLTLPTPIQSITPPIQLPKEASPEAR